MRFEDRKLEAVIQENILRSIGVVEDDEPTAFSHQAYLEKMQAEFTPLERRLIRVNLGMDYG